jgi:lipoate-protein ligase A
VLARSSPTEALVGEAQLIDRVARRETDVEILVWSTTPCLVAPRALSRRPGFEAGRVSVEALGLPFHLRQTGGDLVPQGPNVLNATVAFAPSNGSSFGIAAAYDRLCGPLLDLMRARGVAAYFASVPGAFCDGRFNIAVGDRKLAGTAQRWQPRTRLSGTNEPSVAVLAHAALFIAGDFRRAADAANAFYSACGLDRRIRAEAHVALAELAPFADEFDDADPPEALATLILSCYERAFNAIRDGCGGV